MILTRFRAEGLRRRELFAFDVHLNNKSEQEAQ